MWSTANFIDTAAMFTARKDAEMKRKIKNALHGRNAGNIHPVEKLRLYCLSRGSSGIMGFGR